MGPDFSKTWNPRLGLIDKRTKKRLRISWSVWFAMWPSEIRATPPPLKVAEPGEIEIEFPASPLQSEGDIGLD